MVTTKTCQESLVTMQQLILPNDTNFLHNLMGGRLMYWLDEAAAMSAMKHTNKVCITASLDQLSFQKHIPLGEVVEIQAKVTRTFNTSLEVHIKAWGHNYLLAKQQLTHEAFFTFVAIDSTTRKPTPIAPIQAQTQEEIALYESAFKRRQLRLHIAKKITLTNQELLQFMQ